jgi:hypothetical protein
MVKEKLPFSRQVAHRLMVVAKNEKLRNGAAPPYLPVAWTILNELTKLREEQFKNGIKSGAIHPAMTLRNSHVDCLPVAFARFETPPRRGVCPSPGPCFGKGHIRRQHRISEAAVSLVNHR